MFNRQSIILCVFLLTLLVGCGSDEVVQDFKIDSEIDYDSGDVHIVVCQGASELSRRPHLAISVEENTKWKEYEVANPSYHSHVNSRYVSTGINLNWLDRRIFNEDRTPEGCYDTTLPLFKHLGEWRDIGECPFTDYVIHVKDGKAQSTQAIPCEAPPKGTLQIADQATDTGSEANNLITGNVINDDEATSSDTSTSDAVTLPSNDTEETDFWVSDCSEWELIRYDHPSWGRVYREQVEVFPGYSETFSLLSESRDDNTNWDYCFNGVVEGMDVDVVVEIEFPNSGDQLYIDLTSFGLTHGYARNSTYIRSDTHCWGDYPLVEINYPNQTKWNCRFDVSPSDPPIGGGGFSVTGYIDYFDGGLEDNDPHQVDGAATISITFEFK